MDREIDYQSLLPAGYQLRYLIDGDSVRISRDVNQGLLWAEACSPLILSFCFVGLAVFIWRWTGRVPVSPGYAIALIRFAVYATFFGLLIPVGRWSWQNIGIVTEIAVSEGTFYWRKQNIWGAQDFMWPLSTIRNVGVHNKLLRVYRSNGPSLSAFSFVKPNERSYAVGVLKAAIERLS